MRADATEAQRANLRKFISQLRDPSSWPEDFDFNFSWHGSCAIGLAERLGYFRRDDSLAGLCSVDMIEPFGLTADETLRLFVVGSVYDSFPNEMPSASEIADKLEELLEKSYDAQ